MDRHGPSAGVSHVGLCVSDLDAALRFYCDGLGFERRDRHELSDEALPGLDRALEVDRPVTLVSQFIGLGSFTVELLWFAGRAASGRPATSRDELGLTHLSLWVDDIEAVAARVAECGGTVLASTRADLGIDVLFVADPDGGRVELMAIPSR